MLWLEQCFKLKENQTSIKTEMLAGLTTFLTMSYIIFVNPAILSDAGMPQGAVFTATCLITVFATLLLAISSNNPIAVAPGMALNTYFSYVIVGTLGYSWQSALGMVFISGLLFILLTLTNVRSLLISALPKNIKIATLIGISLLIALIALENNHIIIHNKDTLIQLGQVKTISSLLFWSGFVCILILDYFRISAAILISIVLITLISLLLKQTQWHGLIALPPSLTPTLFKLDFHSILELDAIKHIFTFFLIALFDATGTLVGILNQPFFKTQKHHDKRIGAGLFADSIATTFAAILGTSSTSPFIESGTGIQAGGRTGLTALTISLLFLLAMFFYPIVQSIPPYAVGPALLYIACCMFKGVHQLEVDCISEFAPAAIIILMIPFSFSIADGIGLGILCYCVLKLLTGQIKNVHFFNWFMAILFLVYFYFR